MGKRALTLPEVAKYTGIPYDAILQARRVGAFNVKPLPVRGNKYFIGAIDKWLREASGLNAANNKDDDIMALLDA